MRLILGFLFLGVIINTAVAGNCDYSRDIDKTVDIADITKINVEAAAGSLDIRGDAGRDNVRIKARLCASEEDILSGLDVTSTIASGEATIVTRFPDKSSWSRRDYSAHIDLTLTVPASVPMDVMDSSGRADISNVAALSIKDSSGDLEIKKVAGDVDILDSSGDMELVEIGGNVELKDSSGDIEIRDVGKGVVIVADSAGDIEVHDVARSVVIERDSSGSIKVENVRGDFIVGRDSSGDIRYEKVAGKVELPR